MASLLRSVSWGLRNGLVQNRGENTVNWYKIKIKLFCFD